MGMCDGWNQQQYKVGEDDRAARGQPQHAGCRHHGMDKVICEGQCEEALLHSRGICNSKPNGAELAQVVDRRIGKFKSQGCANMAGEFAMAGLWSEQLFSVGEGGTRGA